MAASRRSIQAALMPGNVAEKELVGWSMRQMRFFKTAVAKKVSLNIGLIVFGFNIEGITGIEIAGYAPNFYNFYSGATPN
jgi:hypothetical protein